MTREERAKITKRMLAIKLMAEGLGPGFLPGFWQSLVILSIMSLIV